MNEQIRDLEPKALWNHFADLNSIPRASKKEQRVIQFAKEFGESLGLKTVVDEAGNVIIKKPATPGMEKKTRIILQSHLDMVHQKNATTNFDFDTQGIDMFVDGDWVKARGTTLGADNGIGVASIMTLLASTDIPHPPLEALFTIDEETGMTGALALKGGMLEGKILLNLDTEDDDELTIGCAGGVDVTSEGSYQEENAEGKAYKITLSGLAGGHSGVEIHKGRANSNKLMNRVLLQLSEELDLRISSIDGGGLRNAIPRESVALIVLKEEKSSRLNEIIAEYDKTIKAEYSFTDPNINIKAEPFNETAKVLNKDFQFKLLRCIYACPNGIYRMSPDIEGLVQTSNNVARVLVKDGKYTVQCLTRSSVNTEKTDLADVIRSVFELLGSTVSRNGEYPGWKPKPDAPIVHLLSDTYKELFKEEAHISAIHAGLECGILGRNYPEVDMISFGPNIYGAHSPDERAQISSVQKFWKLLLEVLKRIP
jgi:dipeptidase D